MSYDEFDALPELEDGSVVELADGNLELSPGAASDHQMISVELLYAIKHTCELEYVILHEIDVILSPKEVRRPDLVMVSRKRMEIITKKGIKGAPDLVVEIVSPTSVRRDKISKLKAYATYGIPEYWIILPAQELLEQYVLGMDGKYELHDVYVENEEVASERLPCVSFTMKEIMSKIPELPD
ncbi:Uma2 family endonuclease [Paenibacillus koleovorans]|uniref:Uma2 family endonuclease n=1 Tax=Paenibacillus koleovorans TaxID=121608 RepID=UPI001FEA0BCF|nr:Uma2 family endonuclease [Paenibacillus koleovorans]